MTNEQTHTITLENGFTDAKGVTHKELTFGYRLTGLDLVEIDRSTDGQSNEVVKFWTYKTTLTAFGTLHQAAFLGALLSLEDVELDEVEAGLAAFLTKAGAAPEFISETVVRLAFGIVREGVTYNTVTFGNPLRGVELVEADRLNLSGVRRNFYLVGAQVSRISTGDGEQSIDGPLDIEAFYPMDADDVFALRNGAEMWKAKRRRDYIARNAKEASGDASASDTNTESVN